MKYCSELADRKGIPLNDFLENMVANRTTANYGLYISITQRCPMTCKHCSTNSEVKSPNNLSFVHIKKFFNSITKTCKPQLILLTGGEPLLFPEKVEFIAKHAKKVGSQTQIITGGFWLSGKNKRILNSIDLINFITFSYDKYHENEVKRSDLFNMIEYLLARGKSIAIQTVIDPFDSDYTEKLLTEIGITFDGKVPVHVAPTENIGRAKDILINKQQKYNYDDLKYPCLKTSWPVISYTGAIVACCNQDIVDSSAPPEHLVLGWINKSKYSEVVKNNLSRNELKGLRVYGPISIDADKNIKEYCTPCFKEQKLNKKYLTKVKHNDFKRDEKIITLFTKGLTSNEVKHPRRP